MQEVRTSAAVKSALEEMGVDFQPGWAGGTGIVANIGSGTPVVALRADMDALPIQEEGDLEFKSQVRSSFLKILTFLKFLCPQVQKTDMQARVVSTGTRPNARMRS